jgi:hypothetical protein
MHLPFSVQVVAPFFQTYLSITHSLPSVIVKMHDLVVVEKDRPGGGVPAKLEFYENAGEAAGESGLTFAAFALKI